MNYYLKYLKYKNKYLELLGSGPISDESKETYKFEFDINKCSDKYWDDLIKFLDVFGKNDRIKDEKYKRIQMTEDKLPKCTYTDTAILNCKRDDFFFEENTKQIILGRYNDTVGCFYNCSENYFVIGIAPYTIFKNDLFIKYGIDPHHFKHFTGDNSELETIFPIRILLSKNNEIPYHEFMDSIDLRRYYSELKIIDSHNGPIKQIQVVKSAITAINKAYIEGHAPKSLREKLTTLNKTNVLAREMCMLFNMNLYFYYVEKESGALIEPFILVSKFNLEEIIKKISEKKNIYSRIRLLYHKE